ncbi:beta-glucosidase [Paenibacillus sp. BC26]|uniref:beta-glucosidase family protein n=1 Tax=Paenibacillus sp. BC26 TaxID=1881032 RepID=UPI0008E3B9B2|nr:glycoside hydrolase family 3 C-terminal domain-containing protein [Paenibacillus sp. BC26]SFS54444.1 beta-glucosidase [Paenibacillus sp. BC26]
MHESRDMKSLISQMTLEEKASLCSGSDTWHTRGIERLGIPSVMMTDGPHGLRKQKASADHLGLFDSVPSTCFPSAAGVASSWNRALIQRMGEALGIECQAEEVGVLLGPGVNIKRSPLCGRNFEYFSEDPFLSSEMAASHIAGVQSQGVGASLKHFAANNQEHRRMTSDSVVDERTLREIYLASFEGAVKQAQPWTVMCAYNKVNGEYASENKQLLTDILKDEWGHEGFVVSDWGAVEDRAKGLAAGLELEMPASNGEGDLRILEAIRNGEMTEKELDDAVERILKIVFRAVDSRRPGTTFDQAAHHRLAREVAQESMVLLMNEDDILPLRKGSKLAIIGAMAKEPRYQGSGSSQIRPTQMDDIIAELGKSAGEAAELVFAKGYESDADEADSQLTAEAVKAASDAEAAVLFAGLPKRYESEGFDRRHLRMPANQIALIEAIAAVQPNLIVVLCNGAPVEMPWLACAKGVLEAYLGGQAMGGAVADLLFGDANPSGRLAETFPVQLSDNPSYLFYPGEGDRSEYREGIFVGYRYYDKKNVQPLFPFGYGLSYTAFAYSDLTLDKKTMRDTDMLQVSVKVTNTGPRAGKEVVQLYVSDEVSTVIRPDKELKGFDKVELEPGETKTVSFELNKRCFAYYDTEAEEWTVESGVFKLLIGHSSREIMLTEEVSVISTSDRKLSFHRNSTLSELSRTPAGEAFVQRLIANLPFASALHSEHAALLKAFLEHMPLRGLLSFSGGKFTEIQLAAVIRGLNGEDAS